MVTMSQIFERHVLKYASLRCPIARAGRPRLLTDAEALSALFKITRTGMQWREVSASVSYATLFRRIQTWAKESVVIEAYRDTLRAYRKLVPIRHSSAVSGQPCSRAHCRRVRWPPEAAFAHVLQSHGQPCSRAHCRTSRWPPAAANAHVRSFHGQPCWRAHRSRGMEHTKSFTTIRPVGWSMRRYQSLLTHVTADS